MPKKASQILIISNIIKERGLDQLTDQYAIFMNVCNNPMIVNSLDRPEDLEKIKFKPSRSAIGGVSSPLRKGATIHLKSHDKQKRYSIYESLGSEVKSNIDKRTPARQTTDNKRR